jgi:pyruvate dehydrogenase E2 component (dihydrolipoamide acetyltransferase)
VSDTIEIRVPDIGDFKDVPVIEVLVKPGDTVKKEDSLVVLESDKASMEVPASAAGVVAAVMVKVGDKVSQGSVVVTLEGSASGPSTTAQSASAQDDKVVSPSTGADAASSPSAGANAVSSPSSGANAASSASAGANAASSASAGANAASSASAAPSLVTLSEARSAQSKGEPVTLLVPDIGDFGDVPVIEVLVKPGDTVKKEDSLVVLESDKASMEVPASQAGVVESVLVKVGDKVSKGTPVVTLQGGAPSAPSSFDSAQSAPLRMTTGGASAQDDKAGRAAAPADDKAEPGGNVHASPSIRRFARELGVNIHELRGSGPNGRVTRDDVQNFVKSALARGPAASAGASPFPGLPPWPKVDFAQYGEIERKPLGRIKKLSGPNLHRNWISIPHITNQDEADITELEEFRNEINAEQAKKKGPKFTILAFLVKASVAALERFPEFNASLDGDELVYKHYYNIGFAADTPNGLMVPVIKNADRKGLIEIARETSELAAKARDGKLSLGDMQGGTFTISSIGGIGGTAFTQIVNAPEVAILGSVRSSMKPVWDGKAFVPRLILPISVSYDHRVIDGAGAARFLAYVASLLADFRRVAL